MQLAINLRHISAGMTAVVVGYSSSLILVVEAARLAGADSAQIISWLLALGLMMGVTCIGLSWRYGMPIVTAWSTPGAAFLIGSVNGFSLAEVIGACLAAGVFALLAAQLKPLTRLIERIPHSLSAAMLAGILLPFCLEVFSQGAEDPLMLGLFFLLYVAGSRFFPRYLMLSILSLAIIWADALGSFSQLEWQLPTFVWVTPHFSVSSLLGLALPLFLITMLSQNLPGIAILHNHGYQPPTRNVLSWIASINIIAAPVGGFSLNLAAITAAICMGEQADPDPKQRKWAAISAGIGYSLFGLGAGVVVAIFTQMPSYLTTLLAGFALIATLQNAMTNMLAAPNGKSDSLPYTRHSAVITFLVTASGISLFSISAAIWGLLLGGGIYWLQKNK